MRLSFLPRISLLPREEKFFFLLQQSALNAQKIANKLQDLMEHYENVPEKVAEIKVLEEFGDSVIHNLKNALHRTFVTPIDREDVAMLAERMDDVVDAIEEAARSMMEYQIKSPTPYAQQIAETVVKCADELVKATSMLHYRGARLKEILPHTQELNRLENLADQITSKAMGALFTNGTDTIEILKWHDIYNELEAATDRAEDAADVLEAIVLKHA